jgi:hypothetical protein
MRLREIARSLTYPPEKHLYRFELWTPPEMWPNNLESIGLI